MKKTPMRIVSSCVMSAVLAGAFIPAQPLKAYASTHIASSATQSDATQGVSAQSDAAVPEAWSVDNFVIEKEGDHAVIKGLSQAGETKRQTCKTLVLPARYDNLDISKIAKEAFKKKEFTSVHVPSSITSIEEKAFFGCKIQELTLSDKLADLGKAAFMMNELTVLEVPGSLTTIPENAFNENKLTSLLLSEGITKIDTRAFYDNNLPDVVIPKSLEFVAPNAFEYQHDGNKPEQKATLHTIDKTNPHNLKNSQNHTIITETKTLNPNTFTPFSEELSSLQRILDRFYVSADGKDVPSKGVRVNKNGNEVERWITPQQKMDTLKLLEKAYEAHFFRTIDEQQVEALNKELAARYLELGKQGETQIGTAPSLEHFSAPVETLKIGVNGWTPLYKKSLFTKYLEVGLRDTTRPNSRLYRLQAIDDTTPTMLRLDFLVPLRNNSHEVPEKYEIECNMPGLAFFKPDDAEYQKHIPQTDLSVIVPDIEDEAHPKHKNVGFGLEPGAVALFNVGENGDTLDNLWQTVVCGYAPNKVPHVNAHEGLAFKGWSLTKPAGVLNDGEDGHIVDPTKLPLDKHTVYYAVYEKAAAVPAPEPPAPAEQHPAAAVQYKALPTNIIDLQRLVDYMYASPDGNDVPTAFNNIGTTKPKDGLFANNTVAKKVNKQLVYVDQDTKNKLTQELFNAYKKFYIDQSADITLTDISSIDTKPGKKGNCDAIDVHNIKLKFNNYSASKNMLQRQKEEYFALFDIKDPHNVMYPIHTFGYLPNSRTNSAQVNFQVMKNDNAEYHLKAIPGFAFVDVVAGKRSTVLYPQVNLEKQSGNSSPSLTSKQTFTVEPGFVALFDGGTNGVIEKGECVQTYAPQTTLDYAPTIKAKDGFTFKGWKASGSDTVLSTEEIKATQLTQHTLFTAVYEKAAAPAPVLTLTGEVSGVQVGKEVTSELTYTLENADGYSVEASVEGDAKDGLTATADPATKKVKLRGTPTKAGEVTVKLRATKEGKTALEQTKTFSVAAATPAPVLILTGDVSGIQVGKEVTSELTYTLDNADGYSVEASVEGDAKDGLTATADPATKKVKLSGTPTKAGEVTVKVRATKAGETALEQTKTFSVAPAPAPEPPAPAPSPSPLPEKKDKPKEETPAPSFDQATKRIAGNTAEDTMQQIVQTAFPDPVKEVVLATSESYWDALSANSLAGSLNAPVLLTHHNQLPEQTIAELKRLQTSKVVVCGGENAISNDVVSQLKALNIEVERVAGNMASDTANDIAQKLAKSDTAVVATSWGYEDALSAASFAYAKKAPIFLANYNTATLDASNIQTMKDKGVKKVYIVGGTAVVSPEVEAQLQEAGIAVERVAGDTAYDTSAQLATKLISLGMSANNMAIATGWGYTDALAGAALCGKQNSVMVLADNTNQTAINDVVAANKHSIKNYYIFGGTSVVGEGATDALKGVFTGKDANKDA